MQSANFYRQFEDRHRGSRAQIRARLEIYHPFVAPLVAAHHPASAIDLGCGRGEWLELLNHWGFQATGVDVNEAMLASCRRLDLTVDQNDALSALAQLDQESQSIVSAFHLVEHLPFVDLEKLVFEAYRVLRPGGMLIMETPNPENIVVGSTNFYLDPTHKRPLPPLLLSFLPESIGFDRIKLLRLQEAFTLSQERELTIHDVLGGISSDYAVIAQKQGQTIHSSELDRAWNRSYGITLADAADQFHQQYVHIREQARSAYGQGLTNHQQIQENLRAVQGLVQKMQTIEKILAPLLWLNRQRHAIRQQGLRIWLGTRLQIAWGMLVRAGWLGLQRLPWLKKGLIQIASRLGLNGLVQKIRLIYLQRYQKPAPPDSVVSGQMLQTELTDAQLRALPTETAQLYQQIDALSKSNRPR